MFSADRAASSSPKGSSPATSPALATGSTRSSPRHGDGASPTDTTRSVLLDAQRRPIPCERYADPTHPRFEERADRRARPEDRRTGGDPHSQADRARRTAARRCAPHRERADDRVRRSRGRRLREAFRILESEGLITVRRGAQGGARVQVPSAATAAGYAGLVLQHRGTTLADVLDVRGLVEAPAARLVAERRDRKKCADSLERLLDDIDPARHPETFADFNAHLVELTRSETLMLITAMLEHIVSKAAAELRPHSSSRRRRHVGGRGRPRPAQGRGAHPRRRRSGCRGAVVETPDRAGQGARRRRSAAE